MSLAYYSRSVANAQRTKERIKRQGSAFSGHKLWSAEEIAFLRATAPDYQTIKQKLSDRTSGAILKRCSILGLTKRCHIWTGAEISKLRRLYPAATREEICRDFPHSTWINICAVARYHGFRRLKKPYKLTGFRTIDEIRRRCDECKLSMKDLDALSGTKRYFQEAKWHGKKRPNYRAVAKAVEALDGNIEVKWKLYA